MQKFGIVAFAIAGLLWGSVSVCAQAAPDDLTRMGDYTVHRLSSTDPFDRNEDFRTLKPGETLTLADVDGPGSLAHLWMTIDSHEANHLKLLVLRMYWDGEETPSVEAPVGDFFGLGTGEYYEWDSTYLSVGHLKALNCFFPMPFAKHARVTITNDGFLTTSHLYYSVEYKALHHPLPADTLYFHAQYRQAQPNKGWTNRWTENGDIVVNYKANADGKDNYVFLDAKGRGQYVGTTLSIFQNQDAWWGEGDDMFFVDGEALPSWKGTGGEDYFLGAWGYGTGFSYERYGAPVVGAARAGSRSSMYRFHTEAPITFNTSFKATMEHGHANHRSDNWYSVSYWYQAEPHAVFPPLPDAKDRWPKEEMVGGGGNECMPPLCEVK